MRLNIWFILLLFGLGTVGLFLGSFIALVDNGAQSVVDLKAKVVRSYLESVINEQRGLFDAMTKVTLAKSVTLDGLSISESFVALFSGATAVTPTITEGHIQMGNDKVYSVNKANGKANNIWDLQIAQQITPTILCLQTFEYNATTGQLGAELADRRLCNNATHNLFPNASDDAVYQLLVSTPKGSMRAAPTTIHPILNAPQKRFGTAIRNANGTAVGAYSFTIFVDFSDLIRKQEYFQVVVTEVGTSIVTSTTKGSKIPKGSIVTLEDHAEDVPGLSPYLTELTDPTVLSKPVERGTSDADEYRVHWMDLDVSMVPQPTSSFRIIVVYDIRGANQSYFTAMLSLIPAAIAIFGGIFILRIISSYYISHGSSQLNEVVANMERTTEDYSLSLIGKESTMSKSLISEIAEVQEKFENVQRAISIASVYIPKEVVSSVLLSGTMSMEVQPLECAIIFCDIDNFVDLCEHSSVDDFSDAMERYFDEQASVILRNGGTIDKFIGDAIMAMWGAPLPIDNKRLRVLTAALQLRDVLRQEEHQEFFEEKQFPVNCRIGAHVGTVSAGNVGCENRVSYTILGDPVNLTARLQSANRHLGTSILISDDTMLEVPEGIFTIRPMGRLKVVGKDLSVGVNELVGLHPDLDMSTFKEFDDDQESLAATSVNADGLSQQENESKSVKSANSGKYHRPSVAQSSSSRGTASHSQSTKKSHVSGSSRSSERAARLHRLRMAEINNIGKAMRIALQYCKQCDVEDVEHAMEYASVVEHYINGNFKLALDEIKEYRRESYGKSDVAAKLLQRQIEIYNRDPPNLDDWGGEIALNAK